MANGEQAYHISRPATKQPKRLSAHVLLIAFILVKTKPVSLSIEGKITPRLRFDIYLRFEQNSLITSPHLLLLDHFCTLQLIQAHILIPQPFGASDVKSTTNFDFFNKRILPNLGDWNQDRQLVLAPRLSCL